MKKFLFPVFVLLATVCNAQADTTKWLRAFPLTAYMVDLSDSVKLVQVQLPNGQSLEEKQLGLVRGVYTGSNADTVQKGYGRCHLIKGDYYYFAIGQNNSGIKLKEGDLLYTFVDRTTIYFGLVPRLASHFIQLQTVYEEPFYDNYEVFSQWTASAEKALIDSMVKDIKFTGNFFLQNDPSIDKLITKGTFKDMKVLSVMIASQPSQVKDFMNYVIARPRLYAGRKWKLAEVFATWASEGAPTVVSN